MQFDRKPALSVLESAGRRGTYKIIDGLRIAGFVEAARISGGHLLDLAIQPEPLQIDET
jgi:hypothetical protein